VFVLLLGIMMVVAASLFKSRDSVLNADLGDLNTQIEKYQNAVFGVVLAFGIVTICMGCCGCSCFLPMFTDIKFPMVFGCSLFFVWIFYIVIGTIVVTISISAEAKIDSLCSFQDLKAKDPTLPDKDMDSISKRLYLVDTVVIPSVSQ